MGNFFRNPHLDGETFFWQGNATGVLLIHGFTATTAEVRLIGEYLRERGYTISALLLPGHGTTPDDLNRQRWRDWTNAIDRAYRDLAARCARVFVIGESMGAVLALYLASDHSEIAGLVLFAPALIVPRARMIAARLFAPFKSVMVKPLRAPCDVDPRWKGYAVNPLRAVVQLNDLQSQVRARLPRITQPVLIAQGRLDQTIDPRSGQIILEKISSTQKELQWFERSAHCVVLDCEWERAAEMAAQFIARVNETCR